MTNEKEFLLNQVHLSLSDFEDNNEHRFTASELHQMLEMYSKHYKVQIIDLKRYIIDTNDFGIDKDTLESRAKQYSKELK